MSIRPAERDWLAQLPRFTPRIALFSRRERSILRPNPAAAVPRAVGPTFALNLHEASPPPQGDMAKPTRANSTYLNASAQARQTVAYTGMGDSSPYLDQASAILPGMVIEGRYRIEEELGEGGMASVYRGRHIEIGADVAIKVLHPWLLSVTGAAEGFLLEARAISRIRHRNVVSVSDFGRIGGRTPFMVMEHLRGEDLFDLVSREGPLPWARVRHIALQLCEGLAAVHAAGVVHRDVKPENCFLVDDGGDEDFVKILDFGVAKAVEARAKVETEKGLVKAPLQSSGALAGTPDFMAPEEVYDRPLDQRVDIYSLGATLFVLLTGRTLFEGSESVDDTILHHALTPPSPPSTFVADLPPAVDALILRALAKDPADRFPDMYAFARAIESIPDGRARPAEDRTVLHDGRIMDPFETGGATFDDSLPSAMMLKPHAATRRVGLLVGITCVMLAGGLSLAHGSDRGRDMMAELGWSAATQPPELLEPRLQVTPEILERSFGQSEPSSAAMMLAAKSLEDHALTSEDTASPEEPLASDESTQNTATTEDSEVHEAAEPPKQIAEPPVKPKKASRRRRSGSSRSGRAADLPTISLSPVTESEPKTATPSPFLTVSPQTRPSDSPAPSAPKVTAGPLKNPYAGG